MKKAFTLIELLVGTSNSSVFSNSDPQKCGYDRAAGVPLYE